MLHCVKFQPNQTINVEMRAKTVRPKKCGLRRSFLKLASETGLFCNSLSYGFCSHFYSNCPIGLKLYTMMHNGLLQLSI